MPEFDFSTFISDRTKDFTGREWVFAEIDRWLADPQAPNFFVITGEPAGIFGSAGIGMVWPWKRCRYQ